MYNAQNKFEFLKKICLWFFVDFQPFDILILFPLSHLKCQIQAKNVKHYERLSKYLTAKNKNKRRWIMKSGNSRKNKKFFLVILEIHPLSAIACRFHQSAFDTNKNRYFRLATVKNFLFFFDRRYNQIKVGATENCIFVISAVSCIFLTFKQSTFLYIIAAYFDMKSLFATTFYPKQGNYYNLMLQNTRGKLLLMLFINFLTPTNFSFI